MVGITQRGQRYGRRPVSGPSSRVRLLVERLEDRLTPSGGPTAQFAVTQDWGSGFQGQITLSNPVGAPTINHWQLAFDYTPQISSIWNASIVSHSGSHYLIQDAGWNGAIAPGSSASFGFVASPGNTTAQPGNYLLNGTPLGGNANLPSLSIGNASVAEPSSGTSTATFTVTLSAAAAQSVSIGYTTSDGTAHAGTDYQAATGILTFAPGQTSATVAVTVDHNPSIIADGGSESFSLVLNNPSGATLAQPSGTGTILNPAPPAGAVQFQVTDDWGSGYQGQITVPNQTSQPLQNWSLQFDLPGQIQSIWNASIVSHVGTHYTIQPASWNNDIPAGGSVAFGYTATPGNVTAATAPAHFLVQGSTPTIAPPVAGNGSAATTPNQPVTVSVLAYASDAAGYTLTLASLGNAQHGTVAANPDGTATYTPASGYAGSDAFTYTVSDGHGQTATGTISVTVSTSVASVWPQHVFAPYVDVTAWPTYNFLQTAQTQGTKFFNLAFVVAGTNKEPSWGGYSSYDVVGTQFSSDLRTEITSLRQLGGDVAVSFGGAANQELAQVITDIPTLENAYQSVINAYGLTHIDFDIEGAAVADRASIDRRSQALAYLEQTAAANGRQLVVSFTLPVLPNGLTADGLYVLQSAQRAGVVLGAVNVMAMDYGDNAAPNPAGRMGSYAIQSATSLLNQLKTLFGTQKTDAQLWNLVGVTPMIGVNDIMDEVFTQQDATQLLNFARQKGLGELSYWSLNRDQAGSSGTGIAGQPFDFANIFDPFSS